jgi:hypothetical protein
MPFPTTRDMVESLAETLPANQIEGMRAAIKQREAKGNPPDELFELHCRNCEKSTTRAFSRETLFAELGQAVTVPQRRRWSRHVSKRATMI